MTQAQNPHSYLPSVIILLSLFLLVAEGMIISQSFDARILIMQGEVTGWRVLFGYLGDLAKFMLVFFVVFALLIRPRVRLYWHKLQRQFSALRAAMALSLQVLAFGALYQLSAVIFGQAGNASAVSEAYYLSWLLVAFVCLVFWLMSFARTALLRRMAKREQLTFTTAVLVALLVWLVTTLSKRLWGPMSEWTFSGAATLLQIFFGADQVFVDANNSLLGLEGFIVNIAPACSGYEGIGLVTAFTSIYLFTQKHRLRFPQALLLLPLGALLIWLLNMVRIAVLIVLGHYWSEEVAVGGFHSQAGWITFILTSLGILWLADHIPWFIRSEPKVSTPAASPAMSLAIATLIPLVVLLATTLLTGALKAEFDWLYPLRVLAVAVALRVVWPYLDLPRPSRHWLPWVSGLAVAVLWALMLGRDAEYDSGFASALRQAPSWLAISWLIIRFIGAIITVPIAEELAFRGYLLCTLSSQEVTTRGPLALAPVPIAVSSLAFGLLHGAWLAGTLAGLVYALVRYHRHNLTDAIIAHGVTNALLCVYALLTGVWSVL